MATMTATFSDGTIAIRKDKRAPKFAWRIVYPNGNIFGGSGCSKFGFAADKQKAETAAKALAAFFKHGQGARGGAPRVEIVEATEQPEACTSE